MSGQSLRAARLHLAGVLAVAGCLAAGAFELTRALGGNRLSWAYAVEWPLIAAYVVYMWRRLAQERRGDGAVGRPPGAGPVGRPADPGYASADLPGHPQDGPDEDPSDDPGLVAWQQYLARLHASDPPGGPALPAAREEGPPWQRAAL